MGSRFGETQKSLELRDKNGYLKNQQITLVTLVTNPKN